MKKKTWNYKLFSSILNFFGALIVLVLCAIIGTWAVISLLSIAVLLVAGVWWLIRWIKEA